MQSISTLEDGFLMSLSLVVCLDLDYVGVVGVFVLRL